MSMHIWTERGYGYRLYNGDNYSKVRNFILKHGSKTFTDEELSKIHSCNTDLELEEYFDEPVSFVVAKTINKIEGKWLIVGYAPNEDNEEMLGIEPTYPWMKQFYITFEEAKEILKKYADILGIKEDPDYFEIEYYG